MPLGDRWLTPTQPPSAGVARWWIVSRNSCSSECGKLRWSGGMTISRGGKSAELEGGGADSPIPLEKAYNVAVFCFAKEHRGQRTLRTLFHRQLHRLIKNLQRQIDYHHKVSNRTLQEAGVTRSVDGQLKTATATK
ncbi:hypothetical protein HNY73_006568 [Argiope bruennichi]|uniref:Uncharacterized protein n=1 Tax=Argiope bruennichi TaxID=94029 RepID=A0A8T0FBA5_ARGBR|nr:hypothetical protein HNY73_006568 [Argiope bruennichi]